MSIQIRLRRIYLALGEIVDAEEIPKKKSGLNLTYPV